MYWNMHEIGNVGLVYVAILLLAIATTVILFVYYSLRQKGTARTSHMELQGECDTPASEENEGLRRFNQWSRLVPNIIHLMLAVLFGVLALHLLHFAVGHIINSFRAIEEPVSEILDAVWLATVAIGMVLRHVTDAGTAVSFIVVATVFLGAALLGWRAVAELITKRRRAPDGQATSRRA